MARLTQATTAASCNAGLTLGLLSFTEVDIEVLKRSGSPQEKEQANRIAPVRVIDACL